MVAIGVSDRRQVVGGGVQTAVARFGVGRAYRVGGPDVSDVHKRLVDEDDGDEDGEAFFGEASDVADERAEVERHAQQQTQRHPDTDPQTKRQKVDSVLSARNIARKTFRYHQLSLTRFHDKQSRIQS